MFPLPISPLQSSWPAIVPYKDPGVFTPCPTSLPSSGAFLGQAEVPCLLSLIACCPYGVAWLVLGSPITPLQRVLWTCCLPLWPWLVALAGSPALVVVIEQTKGDLQKIIL